MNAETQLNLNASTAPARRPRIALLGEFSAGKSTLANLLLGQTVSPVKATATQLPPVLYSHGPKTILRVDTEGEETPIEPEELDTVSHRDTQAVRVLLEAEALELFDLIDMPGTSDPNLPQRVWDRMVERVDGVVWCTPSTQAWRQSEASIWEAMPETLRDQSLLLITRIDKLTAQGDRDRVVARVRRETDGLFRYVLPISLTEAIEARDDPEALRQCGAEALIENLLEVFEHVGANLADSDPFSFENIDTPKPTAQPARPAPCAQPATPEPATPGAATPRRVMPRRVTRRTTSARPT